MSPGEVQLPVHPPGPTRSECGVTHREGQAQGACEDPSTSAPTAQEWLRMPSRHPAHPARPEWEPRREQPAGCLPASCPPERQKQERRWQGKPRLVVNRGNTQLWVAAPQTLQSPAAEERTLSPAQPAALLPRVASSWGRRRRGLGRYWFSLEDRQKYGGKAQRMPAFYALEASAMSGYRHFTM